jgi:hypothetical protein
MAEVTIPVPAGMDAATAKRVAERAFALVAARRDVEQVLADTPAQVGPGHLAQAALREERWREIEGKWGMYSAADVAVMTGNRPEQARVVTANLRRRKGLSGVKRHGSLHYPGFQFVSDEDGTYVVAPAWTELREVLRRAEWNDADLLAWAAAPNAWLESSSPAQEVQKHPHELSKPVWAAAVKALSRDPAAGE